MNTLLHQPNVVPISLGWNCHVALFLQDLGDLERKFHERQIFDWFGAPMWSICELMDRNFAGLTDHSRLVQRKRYTEKDDTILSHLDYDLRFLHEFDDKGKKKGKGKDKEPGISSEDWAKFQEKYARRIERFQTTLQRSADTKTKLLFFRLEQDLHKRIIYPEFTLPKEHDEKFFVERFADQMKARGVVFQILFFSCSFPKAHDTERNIIYVPFGKQTPDVAIGADEMMQILKANLPFVCSCLTNIRT
jgi:hypothetical protein